MKKYIIGLGVVLHSLLIAEKTDFLLIRHGETQWNAEKRYAGWTDIPLNKKGEQQALNLAEYLKTAHPDLSALYSSNLLRACQTGDATAQVLNIPMIQKEDLKEIYWGDAEGMTHQEIEVLYGTMPKCWDAPLFPNSETRNSVYQRVESQLAEIARLHPGQKVAVFTHGQAIRTLINKCLDSETSCRIANCTIAYFTYDPENSEKPLQFISIAADMP